MKQIYEILIRLEGGRYKGAHVILEENGKLLPPEAIDTNSEFSWPAVAREINRATLARVASLEAQLKNAPLRAAGGATAGPVNQLSIRTVPSQRAVIPARVLPESPASTSVAVTRPPSPAVAHPTSASVTHPPLGKSTQPSKPNNRGAAASVAPKSSGSIPRSRPPSRTLSPNASSGPVVAAARTAPTQPKNPDALSASKPTSQKPRVTGGRQV